MMNFDTMIADQIAAYRANVAALNDQMRANLASPAPNIVVMTAGILALVDADPGTSIAKQIELMGIVASYSDFSEDNNPHGERDFGVFDWAATRCYWKIDYYDLKLESSSYHAPEADIITRVLTIMLESEN